ncbi:PQQ-dependent sugar dehydrogenase [Echinicola jeungdonensis]|uniref:PQQ-dependent sugar dehydrogenase n=1 Tax=Echinicola jeungdonensis TaxID=709343 RepID=A0ABV5J9Q5_9BACT|nr:PQQ-dependent sugar dehydrogenase [Echinicola jeungdonensis]MDN3670268.1 PQQ-dependent sugar dehydrogenase [Echinicola jeungdonensis]
MNSYQSLFSSFCLTLVIMACSPDQNEDRQSQKNRGLPTIESVEGNNRVDISNANAEVKLENIQLPPNFKISVWAADVPNARSMTISEEGIVYVGTRQEGKVYALIDTEGDGKADFRYTLASDLRMPNGVALKDGDLYVAEISRILKFEDIKANLANPIFEVVYDQYPTEGHHGWKFIAFGPDGKLYVPVGAPCNICDPENDIFASITRIDVGTNNIQPEIVAHGVRNSVGFDWNPSNQNLWFTDNGRDHLGDNQPDCELNEVTSTGQHFGYPYWHSGDVKDPEFGDKGQGQDAYVAPKAKLGPHVAPLGMRFYEGKMFPEDFLNSIMIAKHGSWNRSTKIGYEVTQVNLNQGNVESETVFATGWLNDATQEVWGRPVDVQELTDGSLLVSDDYANCIYRITYEK